MTDRPVVRASDAEREQAVVSLRESRAAGRLTLEEFMARVDEAYAARTLDELEGVLRELPQEAAAPLARRRRRRLTFAAFGRVIRRGRWRVGRRTFAVSVFGDIDLDLRQAEVEDPVVSVRVLALFGNVDVYVPEGIEVDVGGVVVLGHRREWGRDEPRPGAPLLRVGVIALCGTADVWRVPPGTTGGYGEVIKALRQHQRELGA
jgi:Domain of unknown function (DUF1707)/Cell wall-active antibiotics response 4TMS YvqF